MASYAVNLNLHDIEFLLKMLRTHHNMHGTDLSQAVETIKKLNDMYTEKRKKIDEVYR